MAIKATGKLYKDFFTDTGELAIQIPALSRPTLAQLQAKFWFRSVERDHSPTEAITLRLNTVLHGAEEKINSAEYERRIASRTNIILGYQQAVWLAGHQDEFPKFKDLLGKIYIEFSGLVVVGTNGERRYPYLGNAGKRWSLIWNLLGEGFYRFGRLAVSGK